MIEINFLGTVAGIPSKERSHPCIYIIYRSDISEYLLFDCGEGSQRQMQKAGLSFMRIENIFISHWHADHFAGLPGLIQSMNLEGRGKPLHIYGPEAEKFVPKILDLGYFRCRFSVVPHDAPFEGTKETKLFEADKFIVSSIPVEHSVPAVAFRLEEKEKWKIDAEKSKKLGLTSGRLAILREKERLEADGNKFKIADVASKEKGLKIVYSGDTKVCSNLRKLSKSADLLIQDGTFAEETAKSHSSAGSAARMAKKAGVKKLVFTHISRRYQDDSEILEASQGIFGDVAVAKDFMKLKLKKAKE